MDEYSNSLTASESESITIDIPELASSQELSSKPDPVVASIRNLLIRTKSSYHHQNRMHKVPKSLCNVNPKAYIPQVISIGPLHYGEDDLKGMEMQKLIYLESFLDRAKLELGNVVDEVRSWEERVRYCYREPINMSNDEFVKLIVVDGCFVVEYIIRWYNSEYRDKMDYLLYDLYTDLIKLENQLPFFVLDGLFKLYQSGEYPLKEDMSFLELFLIISGPAYNHLRSKVVELPFPDHFVHLLWICFVNDPRGLRLDMRYCGNDTNKIFRPPTATELSEAGIKFQMTVNEGNCDIIKSITLKNGVLQIPHIEILSDYEVYLRNLIAFEQCYPVEYYVSFFAVFMDGLINTDRDVSLLIKAGIISNYLGRNEDVSKLFNSICIHINVSGQNYFNKVCIQMRDYCMVRRHRWMASLKRNHFNTPWAYISFAAAAILLILTLIQTIFSIIRK